MAQSKLPGLLRPLAFRLFNHACTHPLTGNLVTDGKGSDIFRKGASSKDHINIYLKRAIDAMKDGILARYFGLSLTDILAMDNATFLLIDKEANAIRAQKDTTYQNVLDELDNN